MKLEIRKYRRMKRFTQHRLSELSGISQSYLSQLENNKSYKSPTLTTLLAIAKSLEVCPSLLISHDCKRCVIIKEGNKIKCKERLKQELQDKIDFLK